MSNENNKIVTLELSTTEALVLCDALDDFCDRQIVGVIAFQDTMILGKNFFSVDDPELLKAIQSIEVVRASSKVLLTLSNLLPPLLPGNEEVRQNHIDIATKNLAMAEKGIAGLENQGIAIERNY